jgi:hypothetical protein
MELSDGEEEKKFYEKNYSFNKLAFTNFISFLIGLGIHFLALDSGHND